MWDEPPSPVRAEEDAAAPAESWFVAQEHVPSSYAFDIGVTFRPSDATPARLQELDSALRAACNSALVSGSAIFDWGFDTTADSVAAAVQHNTPLCLHLFTPHIARVCDPRCPTTSPADLYARPHLSFQSFCATHFHVEVPSSTLLISK